MGNAELWLAFPTSISLFWFHVVVVVDKDDGRGVGIVGEVATQGFAVDREGLHAVKVVAVEEESGYIGGSDIRIVVKVRMRALANVSLLCAKVNRNKRVVILATGDEVIAGIEVKRVVVAKGYELRLVGALQHINSR